MICGELAIIVMYLLCTTASIHPVRNDFFNQSPALCIFAQLSISCPPKVIVEHGVLIKYEPLFAGNEYDSVVSFMSAFTL